MLQCGNQEATASERDPLWNEFDDVMSSAFERFDDFADSAVFLQVVPDNELNAKGTEDGEDRFDSIECMENVVQNHEDIPKHVSISKDILDGVINTFKHIFNYHYQFNSALRCNELKKVCCQNCFLKLSFGCAGLYSPENKMKPLVGLHDINSFFNDASYAFPDEVASQMVSVHFLIEH